MPSLRSARSTLSGRRPRTWRAAARHGQRQGLPQRLERSPGSTARRVRACVSTLPQRLPRGAMGLSSARHVCRRTRSDGRGGGACGRLARRWIGLSGQQQGLPQRLERSPGSTVSAGMRVRVNIAAAKGRYWVACCWSASYTRAALVTRQTGDDGAGRPRRNKACAQSRLRFIFCKVII